MGIDLVVLHRARSSRARSWRRTSRSRSTRPRTTKSSTAATRRTIAAGTRRRDAATKANERAAKKAKREHAPKQRERPDAKPRRRRSKARRDSSKQLNDSSDSELAPISSLVSGVAFFMLALLVLLDPEPASAARRSANALQHLRVVRVDGTPLGWLDVFRRYGVLVFAAYVLSTFLLRARSAR